MIINAILFLEFILDLGLYVFFLSYFIIGLCFGFDIDDIGDEIIKLILGCGVLRGFDYILFYD